MQSTRMSATRYDSRSRHWKGMPRAVVLLVLAAALSHGAAAQDSKPHFAVAQVSSSGVEIEVIWKERGLSPDDVIHNVITSEASATYVCLDGGRTRMADRQNVNEVVTAEGDFNATTRGAISGRLTLKPPSPGMFSCPPGQQLKLACTVYANVSCRDDRYAISLPLRRKSVLFAPGYSEFCDLDLR